MFGNNQNDKIRIIKTGSELISPEIKARVDSKKNLVLIYFQHLPNDWCIEDGDYLERDLPGDRVEKYTVLDNGYQPAGRLAPERYECSVSKGNAINKEVSQSIVYNLHGNNPRVYNDSTDNSNNIVSNGIEGAIFSELIKIVEQQLSNNSVLIDSVKEMERSRGNQNFLSAYQNFIAVAANHMTLFAPFLPALTQMLK